MSLLPDCGKTKMEQATYTWAFDATAIVLRYFLLAGVGYGVFYTWRNKRIWSLKIQNGFPTVKRIKMEILFSSITLIIYCLTSWAVFKAYESGITKVYFNLHEYSTPYFFISILLMIFVHDTYFYWTHRVLHLPGVFKLIHKTHHLSHNPTPWASFSFHPAEAIISAGIIPIMVFLIPCHPFAIFAFLTYMTLVNVMGHLGYELFPKRFINSKIGKWQNTSTNHNLHHQYSKSNFGLYFTIWDRLMGTFDARDKKSPF